MLWSTGAGQYAFLHEYFLLLDNILHVLWCIVDTTLTVGYYITFVIMLYVVDWWQGTTLDQGKETHEASSSSSDDNSSAEDERKTSKSAAITMWVLTCLSVWICCDTDTICCHIQSYRQKVWIWFGIIFIIR